MPITKDNYATAVNLLNALAQRQETVRHLTTVIGGGVIWRSVDGSLAVAIPSAELVELETFIRAYLDESDTITSALRAMLGK